jgi:hypothetical protein
MNAESSHPHLNGQEMATCPDRTPNGHFAAGWRGGPGRPKRVTEVQYLASLSDAVPLETWDRIVRKAVEDALTGDRHARAFLANYLIGRPKQAVEVLAPDGEGYGPDILLAVVIDVLDKFDNGVEIKVKMSQAFRLMGEGRDWRDAVKLAMREPDPYATSPSAATQRERGGASESPRAEPQGFALVGSSVAAVHGF